eukprot:CAMPEP_0114983146 /NCGR_PEP_ID=MMETSP0216-20121206/6534_1 /TAXON_ID=223996 /ORGANISM="Protocruzia adherens, Strain Boccale" /LENGTH=888 /DNA_ID=CAMNT_0002345089 /DNA_START=102 /DNA_END=2768 /DNA_ORIENTATION=-
MRKYPTSNPNDSQNRTTGGTAGTPVAFYSNANAGAGTGAGMGGGASGMSGGAAGGNPNLATNTSGHAGAMRSTPGTGTGAAPTFMNVNSGAGNAGMAHTGYPGTGNATTTATTVGHTATPGTTGLAATGGLASTPMTGSMTSAEIKSLELMNSPEKFVRPVTKKVVNSQQSLRQSFIPFGGVITPYADATEEEVPLVNFGNNPLVRCKPCRAYMNPFVRWFENGRRWRCNLCGHMNTTPNYYIANVNSLGERVDKAERGELSRGSFDIQATADYIHRPPMPPVYFFVIDVSGTAVESGYLSVVAQTIKYVIEEELMPGKNDGRTQIGFLTFDSTLHFYNLKPGLTQPQMHVVSDLSEVYLPIPENMLVDLNESHDVILAFLDSLPNMFKTSTTYNSYAPEALRSAQAVIKHLGGQVLWFQASTPLSKSDLLKTKQANNAQDKEKLNPNNMFYRNLAAELFFIHATVHLFCFPVTPINLITIGEVAKHTAGDIFYYPNFKSHVDGDRLSSDLTRVLSRHSSWEAVMRIRVSNGWKIPKFYGHFNIRTSDLLAVPCCDSDKSFGFEIEMETASVNEPYLFMQAALLHTSEQGERRIRVHNYIIPTTVNLGDMFNSIDADALSSLIMCQANDRIYNTHNLNTAKRGIEDKSKQICGSASAVIKSYAKDGLPDTLQYLMVSALGSLKNQIWNYNNYLGKGFYTPDYMAYLRFRLETQSPADAAIMFYPRLFALHELDPAEGEVDEDSGDISLPPTLNLTSSVISIEGIYILDNGYELLFWIGQQVVPELVQVLLGVNTVQELGDVDITEELLLQRLTDNSSDPTANKILNIISALRTNKPFYSPLRIIKNGSQADSLFVSYLFEDKTLTYGSDYNEFFQMCTAGSKTMYPAY